MEVDGVVGILERVPSEQKNHRLVRRDFSLGTQLLEPGQRYRRGRLAPQAFRADLGFGDGDLRFGDIEAPSAGVLE